MRVLLLLLSCVLATLAIPAYKECTPDKTKCEYWLVVQEQLTMIENKQKALVYAHQGKLYRYDEHPSNYTTNIKLDNVVTIDGVNRMVITVNKTVPGPPIVVYENQELVVHVRNLLLSDSVTIHWHGLHQRGTPFMDGVGYISQCPIASGQTFTYQFKAYPKGTFWYHSHVGAQRTNGVFGALIIKEKPVPKKKYPIDAIMTVADWHHLSSEEVYIKMIYGNFKGGKKYKTTDTLDGGHFSGVPWVSGLIEGKGRYTNPTTGHTIQAPITWYNVKAGETYRFRVIQAGTIYPLRISVDGHMIVVVASDGFDVVPKTVESFIINPGERYDFLLHTNQTIKNYWIRAVSLEHNVVNHTVEAVLHYDGADKIKEPTTDRMTCSAQTPCKVLNCPFWYYPSSTHPTTQCILVSELETANVKDTALPYEKDSEEHFLNFAFPGTSVTPGAVNGRKFEFPGVNSLTQDHEIGDYDCKKKDCGPDKVCYCHYELDLPFNKTVQMVWINMGRGAGWGHPIHLHGHSFQILKMAYANQDRKTGKLLPITRLNHDDVNCGGGLNFCNNAVWKNTSWNHGQIPGLNLKNPPRKDTLIIPTGGYAVIRIRTDNPGKWFIHCHIEVHSLDGMAMVITEALDRAPKPPKGFPVCNNFYNQELKDHKYVPYAAAPVCKTREPFVIATVVLALLVFFMFVVLVVVVRKLSTKVVVKEEVGL